MGNRNECFEILGYCRLERDCAGYWILFCAFHKGFRYLIRSSYSQKDTELNSLCKKKVCINNR